MRGSGPYRGDTYPRDPYRATQTARKTASARPVGTRRPGGTRRPVGTRRPGGGKLPGALSMLRKWLGRIPRPVKWSLMGLIGLIVLTMIVDAAVFYNKVHAGVTIEGQSVSGLTQGEAIQKVQQYVDDSQSSPVTLTGGGKTWQVMPSELGVQMDVEGAADEALGVTRDSNFFADMATKLKLYFSDEDVSLTGTVGFTQMDAFIQSIAEDLDRPAVDAGVVVRGAMVITVREREGLVVDQDALRQRLTDTMVSLRPTDIEIPMIVDEPGVVAADNQSAMAQARTMVSTPLTLTWGAQSWTFTPTDLSSFIEFTPAVEGDPSSSQPYLSAEKMAARFEEIGAQTTVNEPVNASFKVVDGKAQVVPAVEGVELDPVMTAEALTEAALRTTDRAAEVQGTKQEPELTTAEAEAMGITDLLATYSDRYVGSTNRQINVRVTTQYLLNDGARYLAPGEEFNFLDAIGPRTPERGFVKAPGISAGMVLEDQYGGGICEISTATFNAAFRAGLKITERRNHTIYFSHYPKGMDATVSDDGPNLRFVNNTGHYIWITGTSDGKSTTIEIYGTDDGRKVSWSVSDWYAVWGPYTHTTLDPTLLTGVSIEMYPGEKAKMCMLYRDIVWPDGTKTRDNFESNYKHQFRIVKVGTGTTTTTVYKPPTTTTATTSP